MTTDVHSSNFAKVLTIANQLKGLPPKAQVAHIDKLLPALTKRIDHAKGPFKKMYEQAYNNFSSLKDGITSSDVTKEDVKTFVAEIATLHTQAIAIETAPPKQEKAARPDRDSELWLTQQTNQGAAVLQKYEKYKTMVPRSLHKRFLATRLPVLPLTNPGLQSDKLKEYKMSEDSFFGYPILKNQIMLGMNADWVTSDYNRDFNEAVGDILKILKQQTGKRLVMIAEPRLRGLTYWAWLVEESTLQRMNRAAMGGHFQIKGWAFPFEADQLIKKPIESS